MESTGLPYAIALLAVVLVQLGSHPPLSISAIDLHLDHAAVLGGSSLVEANQEVEIAGFDPDKAQVNISIHIPPPVTWLVECPRQAGLRLKGGVYTPGGDLVTVHEYFEVEIFGRGRELSDGIS